MPDKVVVFDTTCLLCSKFVQILLDNDNGQLYFTGFESVYSGKNLPKTLTQTPETVIFLENDTHKIKSRAVFAILKYVGWRYRWLRIFRFLPDALLDYFYDLVARNRLAWFGRTDSCFVPAPETVSRFLD